METIKFTLPSHWASALVNGDYSGLSEEDADAVDYFLDTESDICGPCMGTDGTDEVFVTFYDAEGLPCNCLTFVFPYKEGANNIMHHLAGTAPQVRNNT